MRRCMCTRRAGEKPQRLVACRFSWLHEHQASHVYECTNHSKEMRESAAGEQGLSSFWDGESVLTKQMHSRIERTRKVHCITTDTAQATISPLAAPLSLAR